MKKIFCLLTALTLISTLTVNSQTTKGKMLLGISSSFGELGGGSDFMSLGYSTTSFKSDEKNNKEESPSKQFGFNVLPKLGYFVMDNLAIGLDASVGYSNENNEDKASETKQTLFCGGPFVRYYLPKGKLLPFAEIGGAYGIINKESEIKNKTTESSSSLFTYGGGIGLAIQLGYRVTFDAMVGYRSLTMTAREDNKNNDRYVVGSMDLKLGFTMILLGE